jgi:hypothetical protein
MKRIVTVVAALGLVVGACGSSDEPASSSSPDASADGTDETVVEITDTTAADDETPQGDDPAAAPDDGDDNSSGGSIRSINDIPEVCREEMASFMREIEPIVSTIDWQTATLADFESIATEFEAKSEEFDSATLGAGCDDLDFEGDGEFDLLIEFAEDEAPGVVGFFEFLAALQTSIGDATGGGDGSASGDLETCADAVDFVQNLMDTYDSFSEVPAADLIKFTSITSLFTTCSPEQLAILEGDEFNAFIGG